MAPNGEYSVAEVEELTARASELMDRLREVLRDLRTTVADIVEHRAAGSTGPQDVGDPNG